MIELARRSFIIGLVALVAAPAIVRAGSIMPVRTIIEPITAEDLALLLTRLDDRGDLSDHRYAERFGMPGHVNVKRSIVAGHSLRGATDWTRLHG